MSSIKYIIKNYFNKLLRYEILQSMLLHPFQKAKQLKWIRNCIEELLNEFVIIKV